MKFELINNRWQKVSKTTKTRFIKLYNSNLELIGYGYY